MRMLCSKNLAVSVLPLPVSPVMMMPASLRAALSLIPASIRSSKSMEAEERPAAHQSRHRLKDLCAQQASRGQ